MEKKITVIEEIAISEWRDNSWSVRKQVYATNRLEMTMDEFNSTTTHDFDWLIYNVGIDTDVECDNNNDTMWHVKWYVVDEDGEIDDTIPCKEWSIWESTVVSGGDTVVTED